jgi:hypothetical protein
VVIDPVRNGLRVWLLSEGRQTVFTDVDGADIPWPSGAKHAAQYRDHSMKPWLRQKKALPIPQAFYRRAAGSARVSTTPGS